MPQGGTSVQFIFLYYLTVSTDSDKHLILAMSKEYTSFNYTSNAWEHTHCESYEMHEQPRSIWKKKIQIPPHSLTTPLHIPEMITLIGAKWCFSSSIISFTFISLHSTIRKSFLHVCIHLASYSRWIYGFIFYSMGYTPLNSLFTLKLLDFFLAVPGREPRVPSTLGNHCTTEIYLQPGECIEAILCLFILL